MSSYLEAARRLNAVEAAYQDALRRAHHSDLNPFELHVLLSLYRDDGQNAGALALSVGRDRTGFTWSVDRLEERGYLCRRNDPADRRGVLICLTPQGEALRGLLTAIAEQVERALSEVVPVP